MATKLKVSFDTIEIINNGEWMSKGEIYWDFRANGKSIGSRSSANALKKADGDDIDVSASDVLTVSDGQILTISGSVRERDNMDKDEYAPFKQEFTKAKNWGIGSQTAPALDGKLNVKVHYRIERA